MVWFQISPRNQPKAPRWSFSFFNFVEQRPRWLFLHEPPPALDWVGLRHELHPSPLHARFGNFMSRMDGSVLRHFAHL